MKRKYTRRSFGGKNRKKSVEAEGKNEPITEEKIAKEETKVEEKIKEDRKEIVADNRA